MPSNKFAVTYALDRDGGVDPGDEIVAEMQGLCRQRFSSNRSFRGSLRYSAICSRKHLSLLNVELAPQRDIDKPIRAQRKTRRPFGGVQVLSQKNYPNCSQVEHVLAGFAASR